ncbi:SUMF1/EgtB/PvdO family nonheme iron enzyme [Runella salmonicolor]|uniref:SUMF1/EgtB/PvdO family nonheme iron enzyme n=1 Tax=Runella salmonicolor TaxID=2950278 RepID=A0ABT1FWW0_9BACT|nr:SUMF1/EgtB/PvdO family nonheme iron enzyme [Runella salmonicolor]MCP1386256.1 SUMF1/EgtB/PvdO family nonheme iron enzyme [Runella salmonicolor]
MKAILWILCLGWCLGTALAQEKTIGEVQLTTQATERRLALVIGMKDYQFVKPLKNTLNDANDMEVSLGLLGFKVTKIIEKDRGQTQAEINKFIANLRPTDVVIVYFSGHGIGYLGNNYLLPIDARVECLEQIDAYGISLNKLIADLSTKKVRNSFLILDACRSLGNLYTCRDDQRDPFNQSGLTYPTNNPTGNVIVYATQAGRTADDNQTGRNGLFTQELLKHLTLPDLTLADILDRTAENVLTLSQKMGKTQEPTVYGLRGLKFMFLKTTKPTNPQTPPNPKPTPTDLPFMDMVLVKGGTFDMGSNEGEADEKHVHTVTVSSFYMGKYEVTVEQFAAFVAETNYKTDAEKQGSSWCWNPDTKNWKDTRGINWRYGANLQTLSAKDYNHPVVYVSYNDSVAFCEWLSKKERKTYRLPTEAEWEYAAGNGVQHTKYSWGNNEPTKAVANIVDEQFQRTFSTPNWAKFDKYNDGYVYTAPIGSFESNSFGLHDMIGNVIEWCSDWYASDWYGQVAASHPNPENQTYGPKTDRVLRGGSWRDLHYGARVAFRDYCTLGNRYAYVGFRVVSPSQ